MVEVAPVFFEPEVAVWHCCKPSSQLRLSVSRTKTFSIEIIVA